MLSTSNSSKESHPDSPCSIQIPLSDEAPVPCDVRNFLRQIISSCMVTLFTSLTVRAIHLEEFHE